MAAVTAATVALPRLPSPALEAVERPVASVTTAPGFETVTYMIDGVFRSRTPSAAAG